jgi:uncharacterized protein YndB with AHSA1/START domain
VTIKAEIELPIARPAEAVWAELTALERYPEWLRESGVTHVEREIGPLGSGTRLRIRQQLAGRPALLEGIVTAWDPPHHFAFRATHPDGITVEADSLLVDEGPTCRLRWSLRIGLPMRLRMFEGLAAPQARRAATADLLGFKRFLESVAG